MTTDASDDGTTPRVELPPTAELDEELIQHLPRGDDGEIPNVFKGMVAHPRLFRKWAPFASHLLHRSSLDARSRELVILCTAGVEGSDYELHHHREIGAAVGLTVDEVDAAVAGDPSPFTGTEQAVMTGAVELARDGDLSDPTWDLVSRHLDREQVHDLVFTVGNYHSIALFVRTFRIPTDG